MTLANTVLTQRDGATLIVTINRPQARNAVDSATAAALTSAFQEFDNDDSLSVAILTGAEGTFCAGADLREVATGNRQLTLQDADGPMGPSRRLLSKPVDLRVAARDAIFGVYCRRFGVPLIDLGTVRLPRLIGQSQALDLILTGRGVHGEEALRMGLANRLVEPGQALEGALQLARELAALPQRCLRSDRLSAYEQWDLAWREATQNEYRRGLDVLATGESVAGARRFSSGKGRHGEPG